MLDFFARLCIEQASLFQFFHRKDGDVCWLPYKFPWQMHARFNISPYFLFSLFFPFLSLVTFFVIPRYLWIHADGYSKRTDVHWRRILESNRNVNFHWNWMKMEKKICTRLELFWFLCAWKIFGISILSKHLYLFRVDNQRSWKL